MFGRGATFRFILRAAGEFDTVLPACIPIHYGAIKGPTVTKSPEQEAREVIDRLLNLAGWAVQDVKCANIHARRGVALREFPLNPGHGFADYLLYVDGKASGVI